MQDENTTRLTPAIIRQMREGRGMTIKQFWGRVGYSMSRGHAYETSRTELPEHARRLIYLEYVAGIPTNIDSEQFRQFEAAVSLMKVGQTMKSGIEAIQNTLARLNP